MPRATTRAKRPRGASAKRAAPLLQPRDVRSYLLEHAAQIAPADVDGLVARVAEVHDKAASDAPRHPLFRRQIDFALQLLGDHVAGRCPQIPFHTIALLTAALYYWLQPIDVIPDFIPVAGTSDDALVLELAFELAAAGVDRYCTFMDLPRESVLPAAARPHR